MRCRGGVRLRGVAGGYRGFTLGPLDFEAPEGSVVAVIGPNGSGKTTLLRLLAGILPLRAGRAEACGEEARAGGRLRGERIAAYVPAAPQADPWARVSEVLAAAGAEAPPWLEGLLDRRMMELSSGQRRLVCLARALGSRAPLLLVDEPTAFLDLANQGRALWLLRRHARGGGVVFAAMHELHLVWDVADLVVLLAAGRVAAAGPPGEVVRREVVERVYGARLREARADGSIILLPKPQPPPGEG